MPAYTYEMKVGETMFGGGPGILFLGRQSRVPNDAQTKLPQAPTLPQQPDPDLEVDESRAAPPEASAGGDVPTGEDSSV